MRVLSPSKSIRTYIIQSDTTPRSDVEKFKRFAINKPARLRPNANRQRASLARLADRW